MHTANLINKQKGSTQVVMSQTKEQKMLTKSRKIKVKPQPASIKKIGKLIVSLASVGMSSDHIRINAVARKITCKKIIFLVLLKTKSFLQFQTAQNKAHTPTRMCLAISESIPSSHIPNNVLTVFGGVMLKAMWTVRQGQSRKGVWWIHPDHKNYILYVLSGCVLPGCP